LPYFWVREGVLYPIVIGSIVIGSIVIGSIVIGSIVIGSIAIGPIVIGLTLAPILQKQRAKLRLKIIVP
jgi:hypothetical protein